MTIRIQREYEIRGRTAIALITAGEFFVACGATRASVEVDAQSGGRFTTSALSGTFTDIAPDAMMLTLDDGSRLTLSVATPLTELATMTLLHQGASDLDEAFWASAIAAFGPVRGRFNAEADERQTYDDYMDFYRSVPVAKVLGLSEEDARRPLVGSATTLLGLVKHLTGVERNWYPIAMDGRDRADLDPNNSGGDDSWQLGPADTIDAIVAGYETVCAESRRISVRYELDQVVGHDRGELSVRMIIVHMIEETARHAGHADILRELIDGATGVDPAAA